MLRVDDAIGGGVSHAATPEDVCRRRDVEELFGDRRTRCAPDPLRERVRQLCRLGNRSARTLTLFETRVHAAQPVAYETQRALGRAHVQKDHGVPGPVAYEKRAQREPW